MIAVLVGRFSPLHIGHQMIVDYMIKSYGIEKCLILIGSSNSISDRTPYAYEERLKMIQILYPKLKVLPLPDIEPELEYFDDNTNETWLDNVKKIEKQFGDEFIFYGGSREDLDILSQRFKTKVAINRNREGLNISATKIRQAITNSDYEYAEKLVNKKISNLVIKK
jgi:nicotinate-nucleotide adenylyltransferase